MGLTNSEIIQIIQCKREYKKEKPSLCMIGKQNILIQWNKFIRELKSFGFEYDEVLLEKIRGIKPIDAFAFFKMLGFGNVNALDYSDYEGADILFDLNSDDVPQELKEKWDFVINGGTLEHIFNISDAIKNISKMAKVGGIIYHISPLAGWIDHGFYSISPTFYMDYYQENNWKIKCINMEFLNKSGSSLYSQDCRLFGSSLEINEYIKDIKCENYPHVMLQCIVEKTAGLTRDIPTQGYYKNVYRVNNKTIDYAKVADFVKKCGKKKVGLYGAGYDGIQVFEEILKANIDEYICCFYDKDLKKIGMSIAGLEVKYPNLKNMEEAELIVIASAKFENEIYKELLNTGGVQETCIVRGTMI